MDLSKILELNRLPLDKGLLVSTEKLKGQETQMFCHLIIDFRAHTNLITLFSDQIMKNGFKVSESQPVV